MSSAGDATGPINPLDRVIAEYLEAVEAGELPERQEWLDRHPQLAEGLVAFFADLDRMDRQAGPLREARPATVGYFGDFELLEEVARGGMGVVYKARQVSLNRVVALKMILKGALAGERDVARFRLEAEAAAGLDHPNIVPIYEVGEHEGQQYFAMKYVEGGSLARRPQGTPREEVARSAEVARAVHFAHQRGILHRDLKPSNVLVDGGGSQYVSDFGLARRLGDLGVALTETGAIVGTPRYMAPEQAEGRKNLTVAADVYSLGVILYERLTGRVPFDAEDLMTLVRQVREREPVRPSALVKEVDRNLEAVVLRCLEKEPGRRYATAAELADDLERWLEGRPTLARPVGALERCWRWCKRNPAVSGLTGAVAATLVLGAAVASWLAVKAHDEATRADRESANASEQLGLAKRQEKAAREKALLAESARHALQLEATMQAWRQGDLGKAWAILGGVPPAFEDTWEHGYVRALLWRRAPRWSALENRSGVMSVAWSPDGKHIVSGDWTSRVTIWDARTAKLRLSLVGARNHSWIRSVAWSPDAKRIVIGSGGALKVLDAQAGNEKLLLKGHRDVVTGVAWSPDGKRIVSGSEDHTVKIWDAEAGREIRSCRGLSDEVTSVAWSPDNTRIVAGCRDSSVRIWDTRAGKDNLVALRGHSAAVRSVAWSPDGKWVVSGCEDQTITIWDAETTTAKLTIKGLSHQVVSVAWSPDGKHIAGGCGSTVKIWDAETGQEKLSYEGDSRQDFPLVGHTTDVSGVAWSPDGRHVVSGGRDGRVKVWDARTEHETATLPAGERDEITCMAWSPNSKRVASGSQQRMLTIWDAETWQKMKIWDTAPGDEVEVPGAPMLYSRVVFSVAWSPDGKRIASGSGLKFENFQEPPGELKVWDLETGQKKFSLTLKAGLWSIAWSPDGKRIAVGTTDQHFKICDAETGQEKRSFGGQAHGWVTSLAWSPDGKRIISGYKEDERRLLVSGLRPRTGGETSLKVWDAETGQEVLSFQGQPLEDDTNVACSADGNRAVTGDGKGKLRLWEIGKGQEKLSLKDHTGGIVSLAWSPDGKRIATGNRDKALKVWDAETGQEKLSLHGHATPILRMAWSPDGNNVASLSEDGILKVCGVETGHETYSLQGHAASVKSVTWSPDGAWLASGGADGVLKIWDVLTRQERHSLGVQGDGYVNGVAWSPDGKRIVSCGWGGELFAVKVWDAETGREKNSFGKGVGVVTGVAWSPDGKRIASADQEKTLRIWDAQTGQELTSHKDSTCTYGHLVAWSPSGNYLFSGGNLMRIADGKTSQWSVGGWRSLAWSPDGRRIVSGDGDGMLRFWDAESRKELPSIKGHSEPVSAVAWSADGRRVVSGSYDGLLKVWDAETREETHSLKGHRGIIHAVAWSPDGKRVVSGSEDQMLKVWDVP